MVVSLAHAQTSMNERITRDYVALPGILITWVCKIKPKDYYRVYVARQVGGFQHSANLLYQIPIYAHELEARKSPRWCCWYRA